MLSLVMLLVSDSIGLSPVRCGNGTKILVSFFAKKKEKLIKISNDKIIYVDI